MHGYKITSWEKVDSKKKRESTKALVRMKDYVENKKKNSWESDDVMKGWIKS